MDTIPFDFKRERLDSTEYVSVFQESFNRRLVESYPGYLYSIQSETPKYTSISILEYHEALSTEIILINHDDKGELIAKKTIAISGADGGWQFNMTSKYIDSVTIESIFEEKTWEDTNYASHIITYFERRELFKIKNDGTFETISLDSITRTEEQQF